MGHARCSQPVVPLSRLCSRARRIGQRGFPPREVYMRISHTARVTALGALLALTATTVASAQSRPFNVVIDGNAQPVFTGPCTIENTETGTGHATHMGTITWQSTESVDACGPDTIVHAEFVITAATGERVTGTY